MAHKFINLDTCQITRRTGAFPLINVLDEEGNERLSLPYPFTDDQVKLILREMNHAYDIGHRVGSAERASNICKALGFKREMLEDE